MAKARIPVPNLKDPLGVLNLTAAVVAGMAKAGKDSLLVGGLATELQAAGAKVPTALALHQRAKALEKELESLYEQRDAVVAECLPLVQRASKKPGHRPAAPDRRLRLHRRRLGAGEIILSC